MGQFAKAGDIRERTYYSQRLGSGLTPTEADNISELFRKVASHRLEPSVLKAVNLLKEKSSSIKVTNHAIARLVSLVEIFEEEQTLNYTMDTSLVCEFLEAASDLYARLAVLDKQDYVRHIAGKYEPVEVLLGGEIVKFLIMVKSPNSAIIRKLVEEYLLKYAAAKVSLTKKGLGTPEYHDYLYRTLSSLLPTMEETVTVFSMSTAYKFLSSTNDLTEMANVANVHEYDASHGFPEVVSIAGSSMEFRTTQAIGERCSNLTTYGVGTGKLISNILESISVVNLSAFHLALLGKYSQLLLSIDSGETKEVEGEPIPFDIVNGLLGIYLDSLNDYDYEQQVVGLIYLGDLQRYANVFNFYTIAGLSPSLMNRYNSNLLGLAKLMPKDTPQYLNLVDLIHGVAQRPMSSAVSRVTLNYVPPAADYQLNLLADTLEALMNLKNMV